MGIVNLYSATLSGNGESLSPLFRSQLLWMGLGVVAMLLMTLFDYHVLFRGSYFIYVVSLFLLLLVFIPGVGKSVAGQRNWIALFGFSFQPSEIAKLGFLLALARYYSTLPEGRVLSLSKIFPALLLLIFPLSFVLLQKDLGGALFFILIFVTLSFFVKLPWKFLAVAGLLVVVVGGVGYRFFLKGYQKDRIRIFLNPEIDPRGKGYHLIQSKIAVGSGSFLGKGYLKGNMNKLKYLPERHTDFIFPVLAEEWGFLGSAVALFVMLAFLLLGLESAFQLKDSFGSLLALGVVGLFFWHMVINLGGVLGLIPLTGVPLPLFSYGGSSVLTLMIGVGILMNVRMRRFVF